VEGEGDALLTREVTFSGSHLGMVTLSCGDSQHELDMVLELNLPLDLWTRNTEPRVLYDQVLTALRTIGWTFLSPEFFRVSASPVEGAADGHPPQR